MSIIYQWYFWWRPKRKEANWFQPWWFFFIKDSHNVVRVACITMDSWKMRCSSQKAIKRTRMICLKYNRNKKYRRYNFRDRFDLFKPKIDQWYLWWLVIEYICYWGTNESHWTDADYAADFKICDVCLCKLSEWLMFYDFSSKCSQIFYWCHRATNALQPGSDPWVKTVLRANVEEN